MSNCVRQEHQGRIPCASKFRVFPCATFLATGACPYRDRCVFIHDPRVKGEHEAYLYATPGSNTNKEKAGKGPLFWPDAVVSNPDVNLEEIVSFILKKKLLRTLALYEPQSIEGRCLC